MIPAWPTHTSFYITEFLSPLLGGIEYGLLFSLLTRGFRALCQREVLYPIEVCPWLFLLVSYLFKALNFSQRKTSYETHLLWTPKKYQRSVF